MIPSNITRAHIISAIREIDRDGVPPRRNSTRYDLLYDGQRYPPKYVVSIANRYANGIELSSYGFGGGTETNNFLRVRGFEIIEK
jgi:5-methylcytosine-specific restriction protein A